MKRAIIYVLLVLVIVIFSSSLLRSLFQAERIRVQSNKAGISFKIQKPIKGGKSEVK